MTQEDAGHYAEKHGPDAVLDQVVADALREQAPEGILACAAAFEVAGCLGEKPAVIGQTADLMELRLVKCRLGLFGHGPTKDPAPPEQSIPPQIRQAIHKNLEGGRLSCKSAWDIAEAFSLHKMKIGAICNAMDIKIGPCQLGAF